jgi:hypothetical protein
MAPRRCWAGPCRRDQRRRVDGRRARGSNLEAAIIDQLAKAGYDTITKDPNGGQVTEISILHDELVPAEQKHSPISGSVEAGVSNYGSMMGVQLNYDATKPRGADRDAADHAHSGPRHRQALFEGRARIATREGDSRWDDDKVANRLAAAIFAKFPRSAAPAAQAAAQPVAPATPAS